MRREMEKFVGFDAETGMSPVGSATRNNVTISAGMARWLISATLLDQLFITVTSLAEGR